jgi:hypothetical protein
VLPVVFAWCRPSAYEGRPGIGPDQPLFAGQEFPLVAGDRHDQSITPMADDEPPRTV